MSRADEGAITRELYATQAGAALQVALSRAMAAAYADPANDTFTKVARVAGNDPDVLALRSAAAKEAWADPKLRARRLRAIRKAERRTAIGQSVASHYDVNPNARDQRRDEQSARWSDPAYRAMMSAAQKERWVRYKLLPPKGFKRCAQCGRNFRCPQSSKTVTCSPKCSSKHRSKVHVGISNSWSDASRHSLSIKGQIANLKRGTPAASVSDRAGPYESNVNAKHWVVVSPCGERHEARNLRLWCERNSARFAPHEWRAAYAGLRQVAAWLRGKRPRQVSQWRGWSLEDIPQ